MIQNIRNLPINPRTGNFVDDVAAAYRLHLQTGGDRAFPQFHDSKDCPAHRMCSECVR